MAANCESHHTKDEHAHGPNCGHEAVQHGDHVDYVHDGHRHAEHGDHYDECAA
ncbi:MAG TPA: zinc transporter permease [Brevibacterium ravenspurgense]|nr:zinc transporter permease [Brevibacterium ravenspurgense]